MIIRDILVHLDSTPRAAVRLELAVQLAMCTEGYVTGLYTGRHPKGSSYTNGPEIPITEEDFEIWLQQQGVRGESGGLLEALLWKPSLRTVAAPT